jgi:hypothetical protein
MNVRHIAARIVEAYRDGIARAQVNGRTLGVPIMGAHGAAARVVSDIEAIEQEHGPVYLKVYTAMLAQTLDRARMGYGAFLTTGKIAEELNKQYAVSGQAIEVEQLRPMLMQLAADGPVISGGYGWIVAAFSDRHPGEKRATKLKGKAPAADPTPERTDLTDLLGSDFAPVARRQAVPARRQAWDAEPETDPRQAWDAGPEPDEFTPRPNVAPVVTPAASRAESRVNGRGAAAVSPEFLAAALVSLPVEQLRQVLAHATASLTAALAATLAAAKPAAPVAAPGKRKRKAHTVILSTAPTAGK